MDKRFMPCKRCSDVRHVDDLTLCDRYGKPVCSHCHRIIKALQSTTEKPSTPLPFPNRLTDED